MKGYPTIRYAVSNPSWKDVSVPGHPTSVYPEAVVLAEHGGRAVWWMRPFRVLAGHWQYREGRMVLVELGHISYKGLSDRGVYRDFKVIETLVVGGAPTRKRIQEHHEAMDRWVLEGKF